MLSDDQVREIRQIYAGGLATYQNLALKYNVSYQQAWRIIQRKAWRHID